MIFGVAVFERSLARAVGMTAGVSCAHVAFVPKAPGSVVHASTLLALVARGFLDEAGVVGRIVIGLERAPLGHNGRVGAGRVDIFLQGPICVL